MCLHSYVLKKNSSGLHSTQECHDANKTVFVVQYNDLRLVGPSHANQKAIHNINNNLKCAHMKQVLARWTRQHTNYTAAYNTEEATYDPCFVGANLWKPSKRDSIRCSDRVQHVQASAKLEVRFVYCLCIYNLKLWSLGVVEELYNQQLLWDKDTRRKSTAALCDLNSGSTGIIITIIIIHFDAIYVWACVVTRDAIYVAVEVSANFLGYRVLANCSSIQNKVLGIVNLFWWEDISNTCDYSRLQFLKKKKQIPIFLHIVCFLQMINSI